MELRSAVAMSEDDVVSNSLHCRLPVALTRYKVVLESLLSLGGIFFNVNDQDTDGQTMMHQSMRGSQEENIRALIKVGADVNAKNCFGQNCLQYLVEEMCMVGRCVDRDLKVLGILMETGADIFSRDEEGLSIWDTAIENRQQGSYARDALDSMLVSYGYHAEVVEFAEKVPRHGAYTKWYRRRHFDLMWEGKEHLCPYYDDEALGLDLACFKGMIGYTSSDSSSGVEELDEEDYDETESEDNKESGSGVSEEFRSRQTELSEAAEPVGDSLSRTENGVDSEPDSTTSSASLGSLSRDPREASGLNGPQEPLNASVANWLSTSRSQREAVLDNASTRVHEELGPPPYGFDAGHADEIFHNPWTEG
ncbi:hypothetical protein LZ30DRAFT_107046 [Colletotrichum cereale]|nr:hypothetical protein LZ30DRAFT_107046 [Colletotrichum cereale]